MASANLMTLQGLIAKSRIGQGKTNDKNKKKPAATQNGGGMTQRTKTMTESSVNDGEETA
jgi:hypothetical protein